MKIIVRVQLVTDWGEVSEVDVAEIQRPAGEFESKTLGLSLGDGKQIMHRLQQTVATAQTDEFCELQRVCPCCHRWNPIKDYRPLKIDTVFGTVSLLSPRIISCPCEPPWYLEMPISPIVSLFRDRATPELQMLQARLCASLSYRSVASILREFLPVSDKFNHVTLRNRTLRVGERIDGVPPSVDGTATMNSPTDWTAAIDGGFVRGMDKGELRNFEILTGRLKAPGKKPYVFAWVGSQITAAASRVSALVKARTETEAPNICIVTDGANNTLSLRQGLPFPATPILDWFHISMKIRHLEQIVRGLRPNTETERATKNLLAADVGKLRWCVWHNNVARLDKKLRQILLMCRIVVSETDSFKRGLEHIDYRVREFISYVLRNSAKPVDYGRRYRKGQLISSAMAESAVNQVINARMCKRQQMRWTPRGAHLLVQVRCAVLNGDILEKWKAQEKAHTEQIDPEVQQFLERLQLAAA
jgi:hypothetical protein